MKWNPPSGHQKFDSWFKLAPISDQFWIEFWRIPGSVFAINKWLHLHFFVRCWKNPYQNRVRFGPRFFNLVHGFWWRLCKIVSKIHVCYPRNHVLGHAEDVPDHKRLNFGHGFRLAFGDFSYWFFKLTSRPTYGFCTWAEKTWMKLDQNLMRNLVQLSSWWFWVCVLPSKSVVWDDLSVSGLRRPLRGWSSRLPNRMAETHLDYQQPCGRTFLILLPVSFWSGRASGWLSLWVIRYAQLRSLRVIHDCRLKTVGPSDDYYLT